MSDAAGPDPSNTELGSAVACVQLDATVDHPCRLLTAFDEFDQGAVVAGDTRGADGRIRPIPGHVDTERQQRRGLCDGLLRDRPRPDVDR